MWNLIDYPMCKHASMDCVMIALVIQIIKSSVFTLIAVFATNAPSKYTDAFPARSGSWDELSADAVRKAEALMEGT